MWRKERCTHYAPSQLRYLREAVAEAVGYTLTGNADDDDAQLVDRLHTVASDINTRVDDVRRELDALRADIERQSQRVTSRTKDPGFPPHSDQ